MKDRYLEPEQAAIFHQAIDAAQMPGRCAYIRHNRPCCVIAQLLVLSGGDIDWMDKMEGLCIKSVATQAASTLTIVKLLCPHARAVMNLLAGYGLELMQDVQGIWDSANPKSEPEARERMHELVDLSTLA